MVNSTKIVEILNNVTDKINDKKLYLTELDAAIGDGDHGLNMSKGFSAVSEKIKCDTDKDIGNLLKKVGMTLVSTVGGASGPLYGTAFMKASIYAKGKEEISIEDFIEMMNIAIEGIKMRGKAKKGEKTMLDSLIPAYEEGKKAIEDGKSPKEVLEVMKNAAYEGIEYTKTIIATKGRASYLGERSLGHQDAGATSSAVILSAIYDSL